MREGGGRVSLDPVHKQYTHTRGYTRVHGRHKVPHPILDPCSFSPWSCPLVPDKVIHPIDVKETFEVDH